MGNIFLVAYTSSYARLNLYDNMEPLSSRVLYYDTDSIVYVHDPRHSNFPSLGDYFSNLKDECWRNQYEEFVSVGPKKYAYRAQVLRMSIKCEAFVSTTIRPEKFTWNMKNLCGGIPFFVFSLF